ncbi:MAG: L17 family ribosomal protein, partial [Tissierellaceae bacterium]
MATLRKLGRSSAHRQAMLRNQVTSLLREGRIETTLEKAKETQRMAEK